MNESEKSDFRKISVDMEDNEASFSLKALSNYLFRYYGKRVIILLDEYDTPMQEAYVNGYWKELDEQIVYDQLTEKRNAIWSLLLASG